MKGPEMSTDDVIRFAEETMREIDQSLIRKLMKERGWTREQCEKEIERMQVEMMKQKMSDFSDGNMN